MGSTVAGYEQNRITDGDASGAGEYPDCGEAPSTLVAGARYKLMTPANLPISRATCITIPPGFSPSSLLESPVLLTNMKVEPSPTTGSFIKSRMVDCYSNSGSYPTTTSVFSNMAVSDEGKSNNVELKPLIMTNMVHADLNDHGSEQSFQIQVHGASSPAELNANETNHRILENTEVQSTSYDHKAIEVSIVSDRSSDDGYNWRKYGQKQVKGSEYPRSYYKCTYPNCEVKKLFERSLDGQITEIIYKGTHDHPKPQPSRRYVSMQEGRFEKLESLTGGLDGTKYGQISYSAEQHHSSEQPLAVGGGIEGSGSFPNRNIDETDNDDDPLSKRRRMEAGGFDITPVIKPVREPRVVVQTLSQVDILDDGYRWRKYGQKVVRANPNPRSYYKCTNLGCNVRKHVERASHDPNSVITTYEGKHNHDVPVAKSSSHDTASLSLIGGGTSKFKSDEGDAISLDLWVGPNDYGQTGRYEHYHNQPLSNTANFREVQAKPVSMHFGIVNGGINQYGSRENEGTSMNHLAYSRPRNIGRVLTGP